MQKKLIGCCCILFFCIFLGVCVGSVRISLVDQYKIICNSLGITSYFVDSKDAYILMNIRFPRVVLGILVGFSLAFCGAIMQGIFRNPLADPYLLGIASGATSGAALVIVLGISIPLMLPLGAFVGGTISVWIAYLIAQSKHGFSNTSLILAGVAIGAMFSALTTFIIFVSGNQELRLIMFWIMGSLTVAKWSWILYLFLIVLVVNIFAFFITKHIDALSLGDEMAFHLGVHPEKLKKILLVATTLLTAAVVCVSGTIGFVGIIIPHTARLLVGANNKTLLWASGFLGASFLVLCDIVARTLAAPTEIPIGVITAIVGVPFFLYLLHQNGHRKETF